MGGLDQVVKQLILVKADTSQAKSAVKDLAGEEKRAAKERLEDLERQNNKLELATKGWVRFAAGVAGAIGAYKLLSKAADAAVESAKKSGTAGEGAVKAWTDATATWKTTVDRLMVSLGQIAIKLAPLVNMVSRLVADIGGLDRRDTMSEEKKALSTYHQIQQQLEKDPNNKYLKAQEARYFDKVRELRAAGATAATGELIKTIDTLTDAQIAWMRDIREKGLAALARKKSARGGRVGADPYSGIDADPIAAALGIRDVAGSAAGRVGAAFQETYANARRGVTLGEEDQTGLARLRATLEQAKRDVSEWQDEMAQAAQARRQSFLESIFGPVEEFNAYAAAFGLLQSAVTSAFDAWITGQSSIGDAVKAAVATGLKAVAIDASIQALKNTAYGIAALATGPIGGVSAGGFFKAAAMFGGVAVAAGLASKEMHAAGWAGGGSMPSAGGGGGLGAGSFLDANDRGGTGNNQVVVMLGSDFGMLSTIEQKTLLHSAIRVGMQNTRGTRRVRRGS